MLCERIKCIGCFSCVHACQKSCITMKSDEYGFWYPEVDKTNCIDCHLCEKGCPILKPPSVDDRAEPKAFAAYNLDENVRMKSSSGGIFTLLAEDIISRGGVVFGAAFNNSFDVEHICIEKLEDIEKLRGSKYVQSRMNASYKKVKEFLRDGREVLFTGTPCQISGLYAFLGKDYEKLFTHDVICHGCPSPLAWKKYLELCESGKGSKPNHIFFRDKTANGWSNYSIQMDYESDSSYFKSHFEDLYLVCFILDWMLRPSCYQCMSKGIKRKADLTLADFWGVPVALPEMFDDKGCSVVLIHSEKGNTLWDRISGKTRCAPIPIESAISFNTMVNESVPEPPERKIFMDKICQSDFMSAVNAVPNAKAFIENYYNKGQDMLTTIDKIMQDHAKGNKA